MITAEIFLSVVGWQFILVAVAVATLGSVLTSIVNVPNKYEL